MNKLDDNRLEEMLSINVEQAKYYDATDGGAVSEVNGFATNLWRKFRARGIGAVSDERRQIVYTIQKEWLGDLTGKKVLEVGAGTGSFLTGYLAEHAAAYHAIDLSKVQIDVLRKRLSGVPNVRCVADDFLSSDEIDQDYDIIYAQSFFHHFRHIEVLFDRLEAVTKPGSIIITLDPLQTWLPARMFRALFRPFQTDAAWEFPFTHASLKKIQDRFIVVDRIGLYGRSKWAVAIGMFFPELGRRLGDAWFDMDFKSDYVRYHAKSCLILSSCLRTRGGAAVTQPREI